MIKDIKEEYEIEIYAMAYGGNGIGKVDGKVCFVEGALPGERASFIKQSEKKQFINGLMVKVLLPSADRIKPPCPYYGECGGCQYQHLTYEKELFYKAEQVRELLSRIGGLKEYEFQKITPSLSDYHYRSSITLHRSKGGYGFFCRDNKSIIAIEQCPLAVDGINSAITTLSAPEGKKDITLKCDLSGKAYIKGYPGHRFFKDDFLGTELTFSPLAFSQPNRQIATAMVKRVREWAGTEDRVVLFDLYCGVGFFGLLMSDMFKSVIGIDDSSIAIDCATASKRDIASANARFYKEKAAARFPAIYEKFRGEINTILLDPPRSGIEEEITAQLRGLNGIGSLYYVSCNPAILARDAKLLTQDGRWHLERIACFDMFPRTKHIETIALFKK